MQAASEQHVNGERLVALCNRHGRVGVLLELEMGGEEPKGENKQKLRFKDSPLPSAPILLSRRSQLQVSVQLGAAIAAQSGSLSCPRIQAVCWG